MDFGTAVWSSRAWQAAAVEWLDHRLADAGIRRTGPVAHPHIRAWATAVRVPTDRGTYWFKACSPGTAFEVRLYAVLAERVPAHVLRPLAADPDRAWILLPDGGPLLGEQLSGPALARALGAALVQYGRVQLDLMPAAGRMLAAGVADMRPAAMLQQFDRAVAMTAAGVRDDPDRRGRRAAVAAARPAVERWCATVAQSALPASLDHNDLHPRNIFWDGAGSGSGQARFFDWGDAVLAHPFAAALVPLGMVRRFLDEPLDGPGFLAVRNAYLDLFRDLAPAEDLPAMLETACRVAKIARAHTWQRAIGAAAEQGDEAADRFRDAPLDTLVAVLDQDWLTVG
ncbi:phosphotransferase [Nakamurella sp.]|uniref:phosphotransferase n=1 Tax=Nakamurella sp. TaxID=1869182 RepID=UPI0037833B08